MNQLFCDGGVIERNPSAIGGTWAYRLITSSKSKDLRSSCDDIAIKLTDKESKTPLRPDDDIVILQDSGVITPLEARMPTVSNNLTEMLALIRGLQALPPDWTGTVYSDSQVTLGRVFMGWKWTNIPPWMHSEFQAATKRLVNWEKIDHVLLDGHPTLMQIIRGFGKRGHPVSEHNAWCDWACQEKSRSFTEKAR